MSPPVARPFPRFIADASSEGLPYGRWAQRLREELARACEPYASEAGGPPGQVVWFPERGWGGRVYVPATAPVEAAEGVAAEFFGHVSFVRGPGGEPEDLRATADFTDVVAEQNPDWRIDLNEDVIGSWNGEGKRSADVTLVWGTPLVRGGAAVTAELDGDVLDQAPVADERFTLVAVDAVKGFGDDLFLEVRLWGSRGDELASESLYDEPQ